MDSIEKFARVFHIWDPLTMSWQEAKRIRLLAVLSLIIMVLTGVDALANSEELLGVSEQAMFVTMPIYVSSVLVAVGCGFTFGRWTTKREREHDILADKVERLEKLLASQIHDEQQSRDLLT
jgi:hypothetical protein